MKLVFVSSTFKDMQFERDMLQTYAIPTLNEKLREYGETAYFGDLRWGVNTSDMDSDEGSRKVLKVCLDQIDNCKPYMIVLIGERYGWIPAQELIDEACVLKGIEKIEDISVTELEIDYGALLDPDYEGRILFYFRNLDKTGMTDEQRRDYEAESELHLQKIEALKARIREVYPDHIRYYDAAWDAEAGKVGGLEDFLSQVENDLAAIFLKDLEEYNRIPWQERCIRSADRWLREREGYYAEGVGNYYIDYITEEDEGVLAMYLTGPAGSGKTSFLSHLYADSEYALPYVCGLDKYSSSESQFLKVLIYKLEELVGVPHTDYGDAYYWDLAGPLLELQEKIDFDGTTLRVYVDNADENFLGMLSFLEYAFTTGEYTSFCLSFRIAMQVELPFYPFFFDSCKLVFGELDEESASFVLDGLVKSYHKELSDVVKEHILSKAQSRQGAYLKSMVKRLMLLDSEDFAAIRAMGDGMDNINRYMIQIVDGASDDLYGILLELINEAKERINYEFVDRLLAVVAFVPLRFSTSEFKQLFTALGWDFNDLDFSLSVRMLEDIVRYYSETGYYGIENPSIAKTVREAVGDFDTKPIAQYMLTVEELRPYAFQAAVYGDDFDFLHRVLKESGLDDIRNAIRVLVNNGEQQRAIDIIVNLSLGEDTWDVKMLPEEHRFRCDDQKLATTFYSGLWDAAKQKITPETRLLFNRAMSAGIAAAECFVRAMPNMAIELLDDVIKFARESGINEVAEEIAEQLWLVRLKAVNESRSEELFDECVRGDGYLEHFRAEDPYQRQVVRLKAYYEFYEIINRSDPEKAYEYWSAAWDMYDELDESLLNKPEDYIYLSKLKQEESIKDVLFGKALFPTSLELMRYEVGFSGDEDDDDDDDDRPDGITLRYMNALDRMKKANCLYCFSNSPVDAALLLNTMTEFLASDEFESISTEDFRYYLRQYVHAFEWLIGTRMLSHNDYATMLSVMVAVSRYEGFEGELERLLSVAHTENPLRVIIRNVASRIFADDDDEEKWQADFESYLEIRERFARLSQCAVNALDTVFYAMGFEFEDED